MNLQGSNIDLYYFSGTGNTLLAAREMQKAFAEKGLQCTMHRIEASDPQKIDLSHTIGLAFPIAAFTTYPLVWDFVYKMPVTRGTKVFAMATMGGFSLCAMGPLKRVMKQKGYLPIGAKQVVMPSNLWYKNYDPAKIQKTISKGQRTARNFALDLAAGKSSWIRVPLVPDLLFPLFLSKKLWQGSPGYVKVNPDKCTKCAQCVEMCPVGAIQLNEELVISNACQWCMRCISYCPEKALYYGNDQYQRYKPVEITELTAKDETSNR
ncbi:4Fe-4S binding protein [candidate division TA06 bacterium]|nr:4Fe-4S binding protein [candidate division TA06 bacterium]